MINSSRSYRFSDFQIFLKNLEVYGTGHNDDIDRVKYNNRQNFTHEEQAIFEIDGLVAYFGKVKNTL
jgi:hypothetical protein